jgi:predicted amidohydrolase YtcJ
LHLERRWRKLRVDSDRARRGWRHGRERALAAYTTGGAYANFCEHDRGSLAPGKAADLVALSGNLFELSPEQI